MGFLWSYAGNKAFFKKDGVKTEYTGTKCVWRAGHFAKFLLRPYPDKKRSPFYTGNFGESAFFQLKRILASRDATNTELLHRLDFGL